MSINKSVCAGTECKSYGFDYFSKMIALKTIKNNNVIPPSALYVILIKKICFWVLKVLSIPLDYYSLEG